LNGPDGMAFDEAGNIYVATVGVGFVYVYSPEGHLLESIPSGGIRPTNVCFGGADFDCLYVTIDDLGTMVSIDIGVPGYRLPFCPLLESEHPWASMLPDPPAVKK
jgi:gluconolactonase